jgi:hypothetical protein
VLEGDSVPRGGAVRIEGRRELFCCQEPVGESGLYRLERGVQPAHCFSASIKTSSKLAYLAALPP